MNEGNKNNSHKQLRSYLNEVLGQAVFQVNYLGQEKYLGTYRFPIYNYFPKTESSSEVVFTLFRF